MIQFAAVGPTAVETKAPAPTVAAPAPTPVPAVTAGPELVLEPTVESPTKPKSSRTGRSRKTAPKEDVGAPTLDI